MKKIIATGALVASCLIAAPASAHDAEVFQGSDRAWVNTDHTRAGVQDRECDGHSAYIEVQVKDSGVIIDGIRWSDSNGCADGGTAKSVANIYSFRLCEDAATYSCTTWRSA